MCGVVLEVHAGSMMYLDLAVAPCIVLNCAGWWVNISNQHTELYWGNLVVVFVSPQERLS